MIWSKTIAKNVHFINIKLARWLISVISACLLSTIVDIL
nr:MAG TPA: hypothetical protein [Caudoviricetes sp.]